MGCNCKNKVVNNLNVPSYVQMAIDIWEQIKDVPFEEIADHEFNEMYRIYNIIYPNSKGQPDKTEIPKIIFQITQYKVKTKK